MNKLEKSSLFFVAFTFISSLFLLYFKYNYTFVMPTLVYSILSILIILTIFIILVLLRDNNEF